MNTGDGLSSMRGNPRHDVQLPYTNALVGIRKFDVMETAYQGGYDVAAFWTKVVVQSI